MRAPIPASGSWKDPWTGFPRDMQRDHRPSGYGEESGGRNAAEAPGGSGVCARRQGHAVPRAQARRRPRAWKGNSDPPEFAAPTPGGAGSGRCRLRVSDRPLPRNPRADQGFRGLTNPHRPDAVPCAPNGTGDGKHGLRCPEDPIQIRDIGEEGLHGGGRGREPVETNGPDIVPQARARPTDEESGAPRLAMLAPRKGFFFFSNCIPRPSRGADRPPCPGHPARKHPARPSPPASPEGGAQGNRGSGKWRCCDRPSGGGLSRVLLGKWAGSRSRQACPPGYYGQGTGRQIPVRGQEAEIRRDLSLPQSSSPGAGKKGARIGVFAVMMSLEMSSSQGVHQLQALDRQGLLDVRLPRQKHGGCLAAAAEIDVHIMSARCLRKRQGIRDTRLRWRVDAA